jgi:hypothetical protein
MNCLKRRKFLVLLSGKVSEKQRRALGQVGEHAPFGLTAYGLIGLSPFIGNAALFYV